MLVKVPYAVGLNVTVIEHAAPAARLVPHVVFSVKDGSPAMPTSADPDRGAPPCWAHARPSLGSSPMV